MAKESSRAVATRPEPVADLERIRSLETAELRAELATAIGLTARHYLYLAAVWRELEGRGEDLSDLRTGIGAYLPAIAAGTVTPEAVVSFAGQPTLLRAVAALPPGEQKRLAAGGKVTVVVREGDRLTHRMLPAAALTARLVGQVFGRQAVRSEAEQVAILSTPPPAWKAGKPVKRGKVVVDRAAGTVRIGRSSAPAADVLAALRAAGMVS